MLAASVHTPRRCLIILHNCLKAARDITDLFTSYITRFLKFCVILTLFWTVLA
ncbi:hypothetical protein T10_6020, partial [Trichinella papuae]